MLDSHDAIADQPVPDAGLVKSLRACAPYVHAHRGRTFVIHLPGEAAQSRHFTGLIHDMALMISLGVRLVIVFGARPQIDQALDQAGIQSAFANGRRLTDNQTLTHVRQAAGSLQTRYEALLSTSLTSTPMGGARITTVSGNMITARPVGIIAGVDHGYTGEVRRIDTASIHAQLAQGHIVLLSCLGYSPSGDIFNLESQTLASQVATALQADKLIIMHAGQQIHARLTTTPPGLSMEQAQSLLDSKTSALSSQDMTYLEAALQACRQGVKRSHLLGFEVDGALLHELYSRDGLGTMVAADTYDVVRPATPEDLGGLLNLIDPLVEAGLLVARSREMIELALDQYIVMARDGLITACCALEPYPADQAGELACVAVHPDYRGGNRASSLLEQAERKAKELGLTRIFVLTTRAPHWFIEHGFSRANLQALPADKQVHYNHQRNSAILIKSLSAY